MAIVDERGRVFGRWNLLDLAILLLLLGLIPLGYAAYVLFRERPPRLVSVEPTQMQQSDVFTLHITGENFRPYMRLSVGTQQGREFQFKNTEEAEVQFPSVAPGTYDVILYDQAQERSRLTQALTISPSSLPATKIVAVGAFGNLDAAGAAKLHAGMQLPNGTILSIGKPAPDLTEVFSGSKVIAVANAKRLRVPAVIELTCYIRDQNGSPFCQVNGVTVSPKSLLTIETPIGSTPFQVQRVRSSDRLQPVKLTMRVVNHPALVSKIKTGDTDRGGADSDIEVLARITSVGAVRLMSPSSAEVEVTVTASLQRVDGAWLYDSMPVRAGSTIAFRTTDYEVVGTIIDIAEPRE